MLHSRWLLLLMLGTMGGAAAAPVGMPCRIVGKPEVLGAGGRWEPLRLMQKLEPGARLRCAAGAEAVIVLFQGGKRFTVAANGEAVVQESLVKGPRVSPLGALTGASARVAQGVAGPRIGGFMARPAQSHRRLHPQFPGWMTEDQRLFAWPAVPGAATYGFTLFDQRDNVVWSVRVCEPRVDYPTDLPALAARRPYVWRLVPFGSSGKPLATGDAWGVVTILTGTDAAQLLADARELQEQSQQVPDDTTFLVLLAELYREYGVLDRTLEILEDPRLTDQPGIQEALEEAYRQISPYARMLAGR